MSRGGVVHVFDASALIAHAKREPGADVMDELLSDPSPTRLVHAANLSEVLYHFLKRGDQTGGHLVLRTHTGVGGVGLETREDMDRLFWQSVAYIKAAIPQAALADSFGLALAQHVGGTVVTADHPAFEQAAALGICPVTFIR